MVRFFVRFYPILLALFLAAAIFLARANAFAAEQIGATCEALGVSTMAQDRKNLIVCLEDDAGALVWKSMTGAKASGVPVGAIIAWPVVKNPPDMQNANGTLNWLDCNGQSVPKTIYPELYAIIGGKAPNLSGLFLRGVGSQSFVQNNGERVGITTTTHKSGELGGVQGDATRRVVGRFGTVSHYEHTGPFIQGAHIGIGAASGDWTSYYEVFDNNLAVPTAIENRPVNMAVRYLIRARS